MGLDRALAVAQEAFGETVIATLEKYAPNIRRAIVGKQVITPKDIERIAGITGGNIFHGELTLQQLFFLRPAAAWAKYERAKASTLRKHVTWQMIAKALEVKP